MSGFLSKELCLFTDKFLTKLNQRRLMKILFLTMTVCSSLVHAGVNHKSTHIMRHSFATHFMETTKDPIALKGILGHSTMKMTDKYAKVTDRTVFDGMTKFKNAIEKPA